MLLVAVMIPAVNEGRSNNGGNCGDGRDDDSD